MHRNMPPAPPPRRALALVEWLITEAEHDAKRRAAPPATATGDPAPARERLDAARDRLALLRHSRQCLLTGEPPGVRPERRPGYQPRRRVSGQRA